MAFNTGSCYDLSSALPAYYLYVHAPDDPETGGIIYWRSTTHRLAQTASYTESYGPVPNDASDSQVSSLQVPFLHKVVNALHEAVGSPTTLFRYC